MPERVRAMNASIKLLLIVREPVTRAISDYTQLRSHAATATLPLANEQQQQQLQPTTSSSSSSSSSGTSANTGKLSSHSMLYNKLNGGYSSSQVYDNSLGGGGGGSSGRGSGNGNGNNNVYGSGAGGIKTNFNKNPYNSHRHHYETTTASPQTNMASATAQILSK